MKKLKYGSLEDFKSIKIGDTVYIAENSFTGTVTREAYYNHDSDEPSWEIETNNGVVDIYNDISVMDKNEMTRETEENVPDITDNF